LNVATLFAPRAPPCNVKVDSTQAPCVSLLDWQLPSRRNEALQLVPSSPPDASADSAPNMEDSASPLIFNSPWDQFDGYNILDDHDFLLNQDLNAVFTPQPIDNVPLAAAAARDSLLTPTIAPSALFTFSLAPADPISVGQCEVALPEIAVSEQFDIPDSLINNFTECDLTAIDQYLNGGDIEMETEFVNFDAVVAETSATTRRPSVVDLDHAYVMQPDSSVLTEEVGVCS
jgi:hypothetical protein